MIKFQYGGDELYARMERAVQRVTERLRKAVRIFEDAKIPYAVVGGHAVRAWVARSTKLLCATHATWIS